jgi:hypothetical protein
MFNDTGDGLRDLLFEAGSPEATRHNRLNHFESQVLRAANAKATQLRTEGARRHVRAGFMRRHMMMQTARIEIRDKTNDRTTPLDPYLATRLSIYLNSYYLNLLGALDNLAWAATYEHGLLPTVDEDDRDARHFCDLCSKRFRDALSGVRPSAQQKLAEVADWAKEVKKFRDPAAHRLPLTFVSQVLLSDDAKRHAELTAQAAAAIEGGDIDGYMSLTHEASTVGRFMPIIESPRGPNGEHYVAPNIVASDQEQFAEFSSFFLSECL